MFYRFGVMESAQCSQELRFTTVGFINAITYFSQACLLLGSLFMIRNTGKKSFWQIQSSMR